MKEHQLKIRPDLWIAVADGRKTAEVRINDRNYKIGDWLTFRPFDCDRQKYLGSKSTTKVITHITEGDQYGIAKGYVLLSMATLENKEEK